MSMGHSLGKDFQPEKTTKPPTQNLRRLVGFSGLVLTARFAGVFIGILIQILLARIWGPANLGSFFIAMAISMILATILASGFPMMVPKFVAASHDPDTIPVVKDFMSFARKSTFITSLALCSLGVIALWLWPALLLVDRWVFTLAILSAPALAFLRINGALANANRRFMLGYLPDIFLRPLLLLILIIALWAVFPTFSLINVLFGFLAIASLTALWQLQKLSSASPAEPAPANQPHRQWLMTALNILPGTIFVMAFGDIALLVAGLFLKNSDLGIFGVVLRISLLAAFAIHTVQQISVRDLADALNVKDQAALVASLWRTNLLSAFLAVSAFVFIIIFAPMILSLFGPEFAAGYLPLIILMLAQLLRALAGPTLQIIALTGLERQSLGAFAAGFLVLLFGSILLVPSLSLNGAALSVLLATATWSIWLAVLVWRKKRIFLPLALPVHLKKIS